MTEWRTRLAALGERHGLDSAQLEQLAAFLRALREDARAPTTILDPAEGVDAHVADALVALELPQVAGARSIVDIGAGAGVPGLPLAIALPAANVVLVESVARKCAFLERFVASAEVDNVRVLCSRIESWSGGDCDVVCARAVAPLAVLVEYAAPALRLGGCLVAWKAQVDGDEERAGIAAGRVVGLERTEVRRVVPFAAAEHRALHVFTKVAETPARFPRRPGVARKRPLGQV